MLTSINGAMGKEAEIIGRALNHSELTAPIHRFATRVLLRRHTAFLTDYDEREAKNWSELVIEFLS